jgi:hypothetical protein
MQWLVIEDAADAFAELSKHFTTAIYRIPT